jgi:peroxiredoxin Q/BCP
MSPSRPTPLHILAAAFLLCACETTSNPQPAATGSTAAPSESDSASGKVVEGAMAPDVTFTLHDGKEQALSALRGSIVLVYFYPKDDTPGCTVEAEGLRDRHKELEELGVKVFGVSLQDASSHKAFIDKYDLNFPLVVDDGKVAAAFEVPVKGEFAARHSFLIGKDGKLIKVWRKVDVSAHADEVVAVAKKAS